MSSPDNIRSLSRFGRIVLPLLLVALGAVAQQAAVKFGRRADKAVVQTPVPDVELLKSEFSDAPVTLAAQGVIEPITQSRAAAEVAGRVIAVSPSWRDGAPFKQGEELLRLDDADYLSALANAEANAAEWGRIELEETKIGRLDHKIAKLQIVKLVPGLEFLRPYALSGDHGITHEEYTPFGVIGAVTPSTHSIPTISGNVGEIATWSCTLQITGAVTRTSVAPT